MLVIGDWSPMIDDYIIRTIHKHRRISTYTCAHQHSKLSAWRKNTIVSILITMKNCQSIDMIAVRLSGKNENIGI